MRSLHCAMLVTLLMCGCAHVGDRNQAKWERATAASLGVSRKEVAEMVRAVGDLKQVVVWIERDQAGIISAYIAETLTAGSGTVLRFHCIGDSWKVLDDGGVVKWME